MARISVATRPPVSVAVHLEQPSSSASPFPPPEGLSPFSARVLDQLSLTSWLPAALIVVNTYLVVGMLLVADPNEPPTSQNLTTVILALNERPIGVLISAVAGVIVVALVTQSLEFAALRTLEGYWGGSKLAALPIWLGTQMQKTRIARLGKLATRIEQRAFRASEQRIRKDLRTRPLLLNAVLSVGLEKEDEASSTEDRREAEQYYYGKKWMKWAPAHLRHRANSISNRLAAYPEVRSRLLPTRLGNTMRSWEDKLAGDVAGPKMRGYLYAHLEKIGLRLMEQHNQYRNRLDMYAVMTFVAAGLALLDAWLLPRVLPQSAVVGAVVALGALSLVSYRGAISAAVDYGHVMLAINDAIRQEERGSQG